MLVPRTRQEGDTIIEVIMAFAVFSMLAIGSIMLMNQGTQAAQLALEITQTQKTIASQEESLKFLRDSYAADPDNEEGAAATLRDIVQNRLVSTPSTFGDEACLQNIPASGRSFAVNPSDAMGGLVSPTAMTDATAPSFPKIDEDTGQAYGIWVEAVQGNTPATQPGYIDFHIRACWLRPNGAGAATTGTIVRLYIPNLEELAL